MNTAAGKALELEPIEVVEREPRQAFEREPREAFDREAYRAPAAKLRDKAVETDDAWFSVEGRIGVMRYNARVFLCLLLMLVAGGALFLGASSGSSAFMTVGYVVGIPLFLYAIVAIIYSAIKRLHDLGFTGWMWLIGLIPIVGSIWVLYYSLVPGKDDDNNYGARREATGMDMMLGSLGILFTVVMIVAPFLMG